MDDVSLNFGSQNSITSTPWTTMTREPASKLTNRKGVHSNNAQRVVLGAAEILLLEKHFGLHINFFLSPPPLSWLWFGTLLFILQVVHGTYYLHSRPTATTASSGQWKLEQRERARGHYRMQIYSMHIYFFIPGSPKKLFISIVIPSTSYPLYYTHPVQ